MERRLMTETTDGRQPQPVLFIGGLGRSGSTLIEKLLNEFDQTFSVGETVHLWERGVRDHERCGCGEAFVDCPQWSAVGRLAFDGWKNVDTDRMIDLRWGVDRSRRLPQIFNALRTGKPSAEMLEYLEGMSPVLLAAAQAQAERIGRKRHEITLLDSSKHLSTAALLALDPLLDVRVLHLVRDPRGVAYSWTKVVDRPETDGETMPQYSPSRTAMRWVTDNLGFEALARVGVPVKTVRYEDVLADPTGEMTAIAKFAGINTSDGIPFIDGSTARIKTPMHSVAGNPMRFQRGGDGDERGQEMTLALDDAWRDKLSTKDRRVVTAVTGPILARYGYLRGR